MKAGDGWLVVVALIVIAGVFGGSPVKSIAGPAPTPSAASAPPASVTAPPDTREWWAQELLARLGIAASASDVRAIARWEQVEGGNWGNAARFNPLNTTQREPGSYSMNSVGVQAFPTWESGWTATVATLRNGRYATILTWLVDGSCAQCIANAVGSSSWGTPHFTV